MENIQHFALKGSEKIRRTITLLKNIELLFQKKTRI